MRGRGLKRQKGEQWPPATAVALRAGAWIETVFLAIETTSMTVALRAGAWIETFRARLVLTDAFVALRAGAWIETMY